MQMERWESAQSLYNNVHCTCCTVCHSSVYMYVPICYKTAYIALFCSPIKQVRNVSDPLFEGNKHSTVKSQFNEWPPSAPFHSLSWEFTLNRDFLMRNFISVARFHTLNRDFSLNRNSLNRDFTVNLNDEFDIRLWGFLIPRLTNNNILNMHEREWWSEPNGSRK